ncbi:unnamed protein product [Caenorhabditis bovis]|uniref:Uncharacterized protein n=1 Tax=Caenorhabditis bovis TaxID=2654633 RepID=A0A8S1FFQ6_9PELO|nr:unnamed protein product [Caenorhabditis bovis]
MRLLLLYFVALAAILPFLSALPTADTSRVQVQEVGVKKGIDRKGNKVSSSSSGVVRDPNNTYPYGMMLVTTTTTTRRPNTTKKYNKPIRKRVITKSTRLARGQQNRRITTDKRTKSGSD